MRRCYVRLLTTLFAALFFSSSVNGAEIVYPKSQSVTINSESTFFIGNENPQNELKINSEPVTLHQTGAFLHPVKLNVGENKFVIDNGVDKPLVYLITRGENVSIPESKTEKLFDKSLEFVTSKDNVPLRSMPNAFGLNRLQHLEKGIPLTVVGEFDDFYKVQLARDDFVWVLKGDVVKSEKSGEKLSTIQNFIYQETPEKRTFILKLTGKVPYILSESNGLDLVVYNINGCPENKYEFHINNTGKLFGYKSYYKNSNELVIEVKNFPSVDKSQPLKGLNITIDPGHGGNESGAIGCLGDREKDINLAIALKLTSLLENSGANVFLTRDDDTAVTLSNRIKFSQDNNSDIFISIHNNALPDSLAFSDKSGSSVFYFYPQSRALGDKILKELVALGLNDDKLRKESFAVVRNTESLAVLVEVGYMINPEDNAKLINDEFQQKAAEAIKQGLEKYFNEL